MTRLVLAMPGSERMAEALAGAASAELAAIETRRFPDGETYVRLPQAVSGRETVFVCSLARPDDQFLRLVFSARAARELGAASVALIAPYLAYMRQDARFRPGEAVTSRHFAELVSGEFDRLITVDPHLHRHRSLGEIYSIPAQAVQAAPLLARWIADNVQAPLIVGPDIESEQWVSAVAAQARAPHLVLRKQRHGDRSVEVDVPDLEPWAGRQPVLIDDIVSSGRTMIETARKLLAQGFSPPVCAVVHPLFAEDAYGELSRLALQVVSTDTVPHPSNAISVAGLLAAALEAPA